MQDWIFSALAALVLWGIAGFLPKLGVDESGPHFMLLYQILGGTLLAIPLFFWLGPDKAALNRNAIYGLAAGVASIAGTLFYFIAIGKGRVSSVISIAAMYPLVTILLAITLLHEPLTFRQGLGIATSLVAIMLFAL